MRLQGSDWLVTFDEMIKCGQAVQAGSAAIKRERRGKRQAGHLNLLCGACVVPSLRFFSPHSH